MIKKLTLLACTAVLLFSTSCATAISQSSWPITINSVPVEAKISIKNKKGVEIYTGQTPATVNLKSSQGYFNKARYEVTFIKDGYDNKTVPVEFKLNGWYVGNIFFGGFIGFLIVDPITGAMFKLKTESLNETLVKTGSTIVTEEQLTIYSIDEIPQEWKEHLVKLK